MSKRHGDEDYAKKARKVILSYYKTQLHGPATQEIRMHFLNRYNDQTKSFEKDPLSLQEIIDIWNSDMLQETKETLGIQRLKAYPLKRVEGGIHFEYEGTDGPFPKPYYHIDDLACDDQSLRENPVKYCHIRCVEPHVGEGNEKDPLPPYLVFRSYPGLPRAMMVFFDLLMTRLGCRMIHASNYFEESDPVWDVFTKDRVVE